MGTIARLGGGQREGLTSDRVASDRQRQVLKYVSFTMMMHSGEHHHGLSRKQIEPKSTQ